MNTAVTEAITTIFEKRKKNFITFTQLRTDLPENVCNMLSIPLQRSTNREIEAYIRPHLPPGCSLYKTGNRTYLLQNSAQDIILAFIKSKPTLTLDQIKSRLPFKREEVTNLINDLNAQGRVIIRIKTLSSSFGIQVIPQDPPSPVPHKGSPETKVPAERKENGADFREGYDTIRRGRSYVKIFELRRYLSLPQDEFDSEIQSLWDQGVIELLASDPSLLKEEERRDSYRDKSNTLWILLTWKGENE